MFDKDSFLIRYGYSDSDLKSCGLEWDQLDSIYEHYISRRIDLEQVASFILEKLSRISEAHVVKSRVKNPEHLIEKIIRLSKKQGSPVTTFEDYQDTIRDLTGARILHKFKEEWESIHEQILATYRLDGSNPPTAHVRKEDSPNLIKAYRKKGLAIEYSDVGYRSIHYPIILDIERELFSVEVQARTLFEEAWGEVDHAIRYPYEQKNPLLKRFFLATSVVAGLADELASMAKLLHQTEKEKLELRKNIVNKDEKALIKKELNEDFEKLKESRKRLQPLAQEVKDILASLSFEK